MMRKIASLVILLSIGLFQVEWSSIAQEPDAAVITPENIQQLELLQTIGRGRVQDAQWSSDGQWFAVRTTRAVWLYPHDKLTDDPIPLGEHKYALTTFAFTPDSQSIVTGDAQGNVIFWDIDTHAEIKHYHISSRPLHSLEISPNGQYLAYQYETTYFDYFETWVHLWDITRDELITRISDDYDTGDLIFIEDSQILLMNFTAESDGGAESNIIAIYAQTGEIINEYESFLGFKFVQSSDGSLDLFNYSVGWYGEADTVWLPSGESDYFDGYVGAYQYAISADNQFIYMIDSTDSLLKYPVANLSNEEQLSAIQHKLPNSTPIALLRVNPVTDMISITNHLGEVYHYASLDQEPLTHSHFNYSVQDILVFEDILIVLETNNFIEESWKGNWSSLYFLDLTGNPINTSVQDIVGDIYNIEISYSRGLLAVGTETGHLYLMDLESFQVVQDWQVSDCAIRSLAFTSDGYHLAYVNRDAYGQCEESANANMWHIDDNYNISLSELRATIAFRGRGTWDIAFSQDNTQVVFGDYSDIAIFWINPFPMGYTPNQPLAKTFATQEDKMFGAIHEIEFSTDNKFVVAGGVVFGNGWLGSTDLWISENQSVNGWTDDFFRVEAHTNAIWGISISPDNRLIASASADGTVLFFSTEVNPINEIIGQTKYSHLHTLLMYGGANDVVFSTDGRRVVVAGEDGTIRIWSIPKE